MGENAGKNQHFLLFPQCFHKDSSSGELKPGTVWYSVNSFIFFIFQACPDIETHSFLQSSTNTMAYHYGTVITFSCWSGYIVDGSETITCMQDGTWSGQAPTCYRGCAKFQETSARSVNPSNGNYSFGTLAHFRCLHGLSLIGDGTALCMNTSRWNTSAPSCTLSTLKIFIPPQTKLKMGYTGVTLSVRTSVRPSVRYESCPGHNFKSIKASNIKLYTQIGHIVEKCSVQEPYLYSNYFGVIALCKILTLDFCPGHILPSIEASNFKLYFI